MTLLGALERRLADLGSVAVAVSGGVDSMTLATVAHRRSSAHTEIFHAVSAAVPPEATDRVHDYALQEGWRMQVIDAGEFGDANYVSNPVNRCFHCKTHLYDAIVRRTDAQVISGTNTDDLGEYRPGLEAAADHAVIHPFVDVGIDKNAIRAIAHELGISDVAELPAAPCLASRVETWILVRPATLTVIHEVERDLTRDVQPRVVRCRVRSGSVVVELDDETLARLSRDDRRAICDRVGSIWRARGRELPVEIATYRSGSAFLVGG